MHTKMEEKKDMVELKSKVIGKCALCGAIVYEDDTGAIYLDGGESLFCSISCAEETTGKKILSAHMKVISQDDFGEPDYSVTCPCCGYTMGQNEGGAVLMANGRCIAQCEMCGGEFIELDPVVS